MPRFLLWSCVVVLLLLPQTRGAAEQPVRLRVLSYNIHHGRGVDGKVDLKRIAEVIRGCEPDLVALQEVDNGVNRSGHVDQPAELGRLTGMHPVFRRNIHYDGGEYGNAILSRWKPIRVENHKLPSHYQGEQRGILDVEFDASGPGLPIRFLATHFDYRPHDAERRDSVAFLEDQILQKTKLPLLILGDFNARPESDVIQRMERNWLRDKQALPTFPSSKPDRQIDYVFASPGPRWKFLESKVLDEPVASDHLPLFSILEFVPDDAAE